MNIRISATKEELGKLAAEEAVEIMRKAISEKDCTSIILATGASQFEVLSVV